MHMEPREMISRVRRWWQNWKGANSSLSELVCCGEYEAERMAHDLGLPVSELRKLAEHGPEAADLLTRRMAELNLDKNEVAAVAPRTLQTCSGSVRCVKATGGARETLAVIRPTRHGRNIVRMLRC